MSEYLLNIAVRSTGVVTNGLLPAMPVFNAVDPGIVEDLTAENNIPGSAAQDQFVQQSIVPVQPVPLQKLQQAAVLNKTETKEQKENSGRSYFSKHIERVEAEQANSPVENKTRETIPFKMEGPSQKIAIESLGVKNKINELIPVNKKVSKVIPEKKQVTDPSVKNEDLKKNKLKPERLHIERITPNQPGMENKRPGQNKKQQQAPKLVIGKIIVEILPPIKPVPQKVITRVVQSASQNSFPKSNKLSFGLGQL
jgi:hypothetical protein